MHTFARKIRGTLFIVAALPSLAAAGEGSAPATDTAAAPSVTLQQLSLPDTYRLLPPAPAPPAVPPAAAGQKVESGGKPLIESEFHGSFTTIFGVSRGAPRSGGE